MAKVKPKLLEWLGDRGCKDLKEAAEFLADETALHASTFEKILYGSTREPRNDTLLRIYDACGQGIDLEALFRCDFGNLR